MKIAQKLILSPLDNLVRVYDIEYTDPIHIKYELLDVDKDFPLLPGTNETPREWHKESTSNELYLY